MAELTRRYVVMAMAAEGPFDLRDPDAPFVLKPWKDPAALRALETYREHCYPELAAELTEWIGIIASGPSVRGGVGARNAAHAAARGGQRGAAPRRASAAPKARREPKSRKIMKKKGKPGGRR